jgi:putative membrane protein
VKNHLRAGWGAAIVPGTAISDSTGDATLKPEYSELLPNGLKGLDDRGLGLPLQLTFLVEGYIRRGFERGWFHAPQASQMQVQLNTLTDAFGRMETIRLTSVPVAHLYVFPFPSTLTPNHILSESPYEWTEESSLASTKRLISDRIHQKQVLATFSMILPFALVSQMAWWAVPIVVLVTFTLYGIDGIASQLEDPFGFDRNDIKMDSIVEDIREEIAVMVEEWKRVGDRGGEMFLGLGA